MGLGRHLGRVCGSGGVVGRTELQQALRTFHVSLTHEVRVPVKWIIVVGIHNYDYMKHMYMYVSCIILLGDATWKSYP